ncbi:hypothetical protein ACA758_03445 [Mycoplasmopsis agassizii]|uniref:hypothetical protein n=1 Tax=Mycoplasmopsis agassizii TaxID=33922 RepID=UPI003527AEE0
MSQWHIQKSKKYKKVFFVISSSLITSSVGVLIACSTNEAMYKKETPLETPKVVIKQFPWPLEKGAAVYSKLTKADNDPYIQINLYGYKFFTFGNWYPVYDSFENFNWRNLLVRNVSDGKTSDPDLNIGDGGGSLKVGEEETPRQKKIRDTWTFFANKPDWIYSKSKVYNSLDKEQKNSRYLVDALEQEAEPDYQKFISIVKNENDLKMSLRLSDNDQKLYDEYLLNFFDFKNSKNILELRHKFLPWSNTFNFEIIKDKLNFNKYDYLFIKDISQYFRFNESSDYLLEGWLEISKYKIDEITKTIYVDWNIAPTVPEGITSGADSVIPTSLPKRFHSFLIPVEKGKISDFNVYDWNMKHFE